MIKLLITLSGIPLESDFTGVVEKNRKIDTHH